MALSRGVRSALPGGFLRFRANPIPAIHARSVSRAIKRERSIKQKSVHREAAVFDNIESATREFPFVQPFREQSEDACYSLNVPGGTRLYMLNRPHNDNRLNTEAIEWLKDRLTIADERRGTGDLFGVVVKNASGDSFSKGLDLEQLSQLKDAGGEDHAKALRLFRQYHKLCALVGGMTKPVVMFMDGDVADEAAALALNAKLRIATGNSSFRVGQASRGYFPDGGLTHWLNKLDPGVGLYLALTGETLYGRDLLHTRLANYFFTSNEWTVFVDLIAENDGHPDTLEILLQSMCQMWHANTRNEFSSTLEDYEADIARCFGPQQRSIDDVINSLEIISISQDEDEKFRRMWAEQTLAKIRACSPLSAKVTFEALKRGSRMSLQNCIRMEHRLARQFLKQPDFEEGTKAILEGRTPVWRNGSFGEIDHDEVAAMFEEGEVDDELRVPFEDYSPNYFPGQDRVAPSPHWRDPHHNPYPKNHEKTTEDYKHPTLGRDVGALRFMRDSNKQQ